jgi:Raf kinase inhibitor-like YbhB/YbcL family protein
VIVAFLLIIVLLSCQSNKELNEVIPMKITSSAFQHNGMIPSKYTCQGQNINPELEITDIPENTKNLVLIVDDPDAPMGTWDHWVVFNIPVQEKIEEDSVPGKQAKNSWGRNDYGGPCPPSGTHRYFFKAYALDKNLDLDINANKKDVEKEMQDHILAQGELIGKFQKS